jgi:hypothetical protein
MLHVRLPKYHQSKRHFLFSACAAKRPPCCRPVCRQYQNLISNSDACIHVCMQMVSIHGNLAGFLFQALSSCQLTSAAGITKSMCRAISLKVHRRPRRYQGRAPASFFSAPATRSRAKQILPYASAPPPVLEAARGVACLNRYAMQRRVLNGAEGAGASGLAM